MAKALRNVNQILEDIKKNTIFRGKKENKLEPLLEEAKQLPDQTPIIDYIFQVYYEESDNPKFATPPSIAHYLFSFFDQNIGERIEQLVRTKPNGVTVFLLNHFIEEIPKDRIQLRRQYFQLLKEIAESNKFPEDARDDAKDYIKTLSRFNPVE